MRTAEEEGGIEQKKDTYGRYGREAYEKREKYKWSERIEILKRKKDMTVERG